MEGCDTCSTTAVCTTCIDDKAVNQVTKCACEHGMNVDGTCKEVSCKDDELKVGASECKKCSTLIEGCKKCSSSNVCTDCIDGIAQLINGKCNCVGGFKLDGTCKPVSNSNCLDDEVNVYGKCRKCSEFMAGCEECDETNKCTKCVDDKADNQVTQCVCEHGMNGDGTCKELNCQVNEVKVSDTECKKCSELMQGCDTCSTTAVCTTCIDSKADNQVTKCVCDHGMNVDGTCKELTCLADEVKVNDECKKCSELMEGCDTCSTSAVCTTCIDDKAVNQVTKCVCEHGMNLDGTCKEETCQANEIKFGDSECKKCSEFMQGCDTCSSTAVCTTCIDSNAENQVTKCVCDHGMNLDGTCKELNCQAN